MDITSFILTKCISELRSATPEDVSEASHEVIVKLWRDGWFTEEELVAAIAASEASFMEEELEHFLSEEKGDG